MSWWAAKVRRFWLYFFGRVGQSERDAIAKRLTPPQMELFDSMHRADQRHGLDVMNALKADGQEDADLLIAGVLHDCGKDRSLRLWHRVGWSLAERYGRRVERALIRLPGFQAGFETMAAHAARSAELAFEAGCSPVTADLIRHQAEPTDQVLGNALLLADQRN